MSEDEIGCPCTSTCCDNPDVFTPEHECRHEDGCVECYIRECKNCGGWCRCEE